MKTNKLKEYIMILIIVSLLVFLIKTLNVINYIKELIVILVPIIIGFIYAWLFNPLIRVLSKKYNRKCICIILFLAIIIVIGFFLYILIPVIMKELSELVDIIPVFITNIKKVAKDGGFLNYLDKINFFVSTKLPEIILSIIKNLFNYIGNGIIGLILGLYITFEYEDIITFINKYLKKKKLNNLFKKISDSVRNCIYGTIFVAFIVFVLDSILFSVIGLDAPLLLGLVCGITDLIPYIGPYIGGALAVIVGFTDKPLLGYISIIVCSVVQAIENYILQPVVMSKIGKLSPILIIIGLLIFGKLFGIFGMIISTPLLTMFKTIFNNYYKVDKID